jgi:hypothetical protein
MLLAVLVAATAASCGRHDRGAAAELQACVKEKAPAGSYDRAVVSTAQGVTTVDYVHNGAETVMTIFKTPKDAQTALDAEARIGDAHDKRIDNVLYSGGGAVEDAIVRCLRE